MAYFCQFVVFEPIYIFTLDSSLNIREAIYKIGSRIYQISPRCPYSRVFIDRIRNYFNVFSLLCVIQPLCNLDGSVAPWEYKFSIKKELAPIFSKCFNAFLKWHSCLGLEVQMDSNQEQLVVYYLQSHMQPGVLLNIYQKIFNTSFI